MALQLSLNLQNISAHDRLNVLRVNQFVVFSFFIVIAWMNVNAFTVWRSNSLIILNVICKTNLSLKITLRNSL